MREKEQDAVEARRDGRGFISESPTFCLRTAAGNGLRFRYSTITLLAGLRGWPTLVPRKTTMWYASSCGLLVGMRWHLE
jgi:hypothetical protein